MIKLHKPENYELKFNKRLSPFLSKFNKNFKLYYPEKEHTVFLKAMIKDYKLLRKIKFNKKNELKSTQVIYSNEEWKFRTIASNVTHKFLIDDNKFPDWDNCSNLITDVEIHLNRKERMQLNTCITNDTKCLFTDTQFRNFVDFIPYMVFDNYFVCPCFIVTKHTYFPPSKLQDQFLISNVNQLLYLRIFMNCYLISNILLNSPVFLITLIDIIKFYIIG